MNLRPVLLAALGGAVILSSAMPAFADRYDHADRDRHRRAEHPVQHDWHHEDRGYYAPPVVVSPPAYGYYAPPPFAYGSPGITIGINIP